MPDGIEQTTEAGAPAPPPADGAAPRRADWDVCGYSVRGAMHVRIGLVNQDAIGWTRELDGPLILAVSDGHGSERCFRSDAGSKLGVKVALREVRSALTELQSAPGADPTEAEVEARRNATALRERLRTRILEAWRNAVDADLMSKPFGGDELGTLAEKKGKAALTQLEEFPRLAYGATLVVAAVNGPVATFVQLGDGDILMVDSAGKVTRPFPRDPGIGEETESLASENATALVKIEFRRISPGKPALIIVSTDGYAKSYASDAGFEEVGRDLLKMIQSRGFGSVEKNLEGWLHETTREGSGDDISVGLLSAVLPAAGPRQHAGDEEGEPAGPGTESAGPAGVRGVAGLSAGGAASAGEGGWPGRGEEDARSEPTE